MTSRPRFAIPEFELEFRASRAGGPGGQHVNTSSTRVELRWNVKATTSLTADARSRVLAKLATRIDTEGFLRVVAADSRSQHRNRELALARMTELVERALVVPNVRHKTKIPRAERTKRLSRKRIRGEVKRRRRPPADDE